MTSTSMSPTLRSEDRFGAESSPGPTSNHSLLTAYIIGNETSHFIWGAAKAA